MHCRKVKEMGILGLQMNEVIEMLAMTMGVKCATSVYEGRDFGELISNILQGPYMVFYNLLYLLPTGREERGVLGMGSIFVAIHPSCQDMKTTALYFHKQIFLGSKIKKHLRSSTQATILPLAFILTPALWPLVSIITCTQPV